MPMAAQYPLEESFSSGPITLSLQKHINDLAILIASAPEVMLSSVDLHKDLIDVECVTVATMVSPKSSAVDSTELDTPQSDRFSSDDDTSLSQEIFYITVAQIVSIVEPGWVADDVRREPVAFLGIHGPILPISAR